MLKTTLALTLALTSFAAHAEGPDLTALDRAGARSAAVTAMVPARLLYAGAELGRANLSAEDLVRVTVVGDGSATPDHSGRGDR